MQLAELREMIAASTVEDWNRLHPPFFRAWILYGDQGFESAEAHSERAVFLNDVDIAIEWGLDRDPYDRDEHHPWASEAHFPDPAMHSFYADVLYRGQLVDRHMLVSVDGGRAYLPYPRASRADQDSMIGGREEAVYLWAITEREFKFAALINAFSNGRLEEYIQRAGVLVEQNRI